MALNLAQIRAKLAAQDAPRENKSTPNAMIPFWNISEGDTIDFRFLPDGDETNELFWRERDMINLWFPSIKGGDPKKGAKVVVPCNEMFTGQPINSCPVLAEVRGWWGNPDLEDMARKYWKKKSYLFQCFVPKNPLDEESPENPIRRVILNKQVFNDVKGILTNLEIEHLPTDYVHGRDFSVTKSKNAGGYAEYKGNWKFSERAHSQDETDAIAQYGLFNLGEFMPKQPTEAELQSIKEMFEASVNGEPYDPDRWAHLPWRPAGVDQKSATSSSTVTPTVNTQPSQTQVEAPVVTETVTETTQTSTEAPQEPATSGSLSPAELMAKLKARNS